MLSIILMFEDKHIGAGGGGGGGGGICHSGVYV